MGMSSSTSVFRVLHVDGADLDVVALLGDVRHARDLRRQVLQVGAIALDVQDVGVQVLGLDQAVALQVGLIVARVVGHHDHGAAVKAVDQQAHLVVDVEVGRPAHDLPPARCQPGARRVEQLARHVVILDHLELAEKAHRLVPDLGVQLIVDGGDSAHRLAVAQGAEHLHRGVLEKGVVVAIKVLQAIADQRRHPVGVRTVELEGNRI